MKYTNFNEMRDRKTLTRHGDSLVTYLCLTYSSSLSCCKLLFQCLVAINEVYSMGTI